MNKVWRVIDLIEWTVDYFARHQIPTPRLDAELLLGYVLKKSRLQLYLHFDMPVFQDHLLQFRELIKRRISFTPVSYLTQHKEFMSLDFYVDARVLIPRPETELLVETVLERQKDKCRVADIGTGSGAIAISLAHNRPAWEIVATDISAEALDVAKLNAETHVCAERVTFLCGDLFATFRDLPDPHFDWIVSNPPYVSTDDVATLAPDVRESEPAIALFAGADGLSVIRRIVSDAPAFLKPGGRLLLEIGHNQSKAVQELIKANAAYKRCDVLKDYAGIERIILAGI